MQFPLQYAATLAVLGHPVPAKASSPASTVESGVTQPPTPANESGATGKGPSHAKDAAPDPTATLPNESWRRVVLLPGLELHLKHDAAPITARLAQRLLATYTELLEG